jgi:hypothetical protein
MSASNINWQLQNINGLQYWADPASADAWMNIASEYFSAVTAVNVSSYATATVTDPNSIRRLLLQNGIQAVGNAYRCLNLPTLADPVYRSWWLNFMGTITPQILRSYYQGGAIPPNAFGTPQSNALLPFCQGNVFNSGGTPCYQQCDITLTSAPFDTLDEQTNFHPAAQNPAAAGVQTTATESGGTWDVLAGTVPGTPGLQNPWSVCAWQSYVVNIGRNSPGNASSGPSGPSCELHNVFPAPFWSAGVWVDLVNKWQARGALGVLTDAVTFTAVLNLSNAALLNILPAQYQAAQGTYANIIQAWEANPGSPPRAQAQGMLSGIVTALGVGGAIAGATTAGAGAFLIVVGAVIGAVGALVNAFAPIAIGTCTDAFGRTLVSCVPRPSSAWQALTIQQNIDGSAPTQLNIPPLPSTGPMNQARGGLIMHQLSAIPQLVQPSSGNSLSTTGFPSNEELLIGAAGVAIVGLGTWFFFFRK